MQAPGARACETASGLRCPIAGRGMLHVTGVDAAGFLHSQFSSEVRGLRPGCVRLTSYSDARGRLLAVMHLFAVGDGYLLELPADRLDPVAAQLRRFVLRAQVEIEDASAAWSAFGVSGAQAESLLASPLGRTPPPAGEWIEAADGVHLAGIGGTVPRWLAFGDEESLHALWNGLDMLATVPAHCWDLLDIEAGIPTIHTDTAGRFVAQMVNLDRLDALDFRKGCYPGQEVIARTRYLGRIKRRMFPLSAPSARSAPAPGDAVLDADSGDGVGEIVAAVDDPAGGIRGLAVLRLESADAALVLADGTPATRQDPPYPLDEAA